MWLERLRTTYPELLHWLLDQWTHDSEREFGRMRLDDDDLERWEKLPTTPIVAPVTESKQFRRRAGSTRRDRLQRFGRIRCRAAGAGYVRRDVLAVRWAMIWAHALVTATP